MTAQLQAPRVVAASGPVLMTPEEARACIEEIRRGMENVLDRVIVLHDREGWKALGYDSWTACIEAELHMSRSRAYQLLDLAQINGALSTIVDTPIPEAHARELAVIKNDPEQVRTVYAGVLDETGGKPTQATVRKGVDKSLGRESRAATREVVRRSVSSRAEASDYADDAPAYEDQSQETYGGAPNAEQWCPQCGGKYRGERCPCATAPAPMEGGASEPDDYPTVSEQPCTACGGEILVLSEQDDRARGQSINAAITEGRPIVQLCASCQIGNDAPTPDQPGDAGPSAEADTPTDTTTAPPAATFAPAPRTSSVSLGKTPVVAPSRPISERKLDAGDLTRALFDFPSATVVEAMGEALSDQERGSLAAQLIDALPIAEVERLAHRVAVRTRGGGDLSRLIADRPTAEIADAVPEPKVKELIGALTDRMLSKGRALAGAI